MRVRVDHDRCTGHGRCYEIAASVFREDERGHSYVDRNEVPPGSEARVRRAARNCPEEAILLDEEPLSPETGPETRID